MGKTILIVDDEKDIVDLLKYNLQKEGYTIWTASNGRQALEHVRRQPDLVLLDVMIPELDGWEVLKEMRKVVSTAHIPVVFLTAKSSDIDEILGLELGANDYIKKPISIPKLTVRIKNALRKHERSQIGDQTRRPVSFGVVEIIPTEHRVRVNNKEVFFTKKEFETLHYLALHAEQVVSREQLLDSVWGSSVSVVDRSVDVYMRKIRKKLGRFAHYIETISGVGYRFRNVPQTEAHIS